MAGDLFCTACKVKPQARAIEDLPDGTCRHKPCGQLLDVVEDALAKATVLASMNPAKTARKAATKASKAPKPRAAAPAKAPKGVLGILARLVEEHDEDFVLHACRDDGAGKGGWRVEIYVPKGAL